MDESDEEGHGGGIREAISEAGNDFVVPSSNWMRYCGVRVRSIGISTTVPE